MTERLLQFIWQFQYFNKQELLLDGGEKLEVIHPGEWNQHQGPDFLQARVKIGNTLLAGTIELHLKTSDWIRHKHDSDSNYRNVILHVVWEHDMDNSKRWPLLSLQERVPALLLSQYREWMEKQSFIPCASQVKQVSDLQWLAWKERLMAERLIRKSAMITDYLRQNNNNWDETLWWLLARGFGIRNNADAFEAVARSLSLTILSKHKQQLHQLEALLFGQAGLLEASFKEDYPRMLQAEYRFLQRKYRISPVSICLHFLRMRPINFPTIRLAQLAMLIHSSARLFSGLKEAASLEAIRSLLAVQANDYWHYHYVPDELSTYKPKLLGSQMIESVVINTIVPYQFAYGYFMKDDRFRENALRLLQECAAEKNTITKQFEQLDMNALNALDSQSLLELKSSYCDTKRCLDCAIGNALLANARIR